MNDKYRQTPAGGELPRSEPQVIEARDIAIVLPFEGRKGAIGEIEMAAAMTNDWPGTVDEFEISESAGIAVEQIQDEITVVIASGATVHFELTAAQALRLSKALAAAAEGASKFVTSAEK